MAGRRFEPESRDSQAISRRFPVAKRLSINSANRLGICRLYLANGDQLQPLASDLLFSALFIASKPFLVSCSKVPHSKSASMPLKFSP